MIRIEVRSAPWRRVQSDVIVRFLPEGWDKAAARAGAPGAPAEDGLLPEGETGFAGKERETLLLFPKKLAGTRLLLVGAGDRARWSRERLRRAGASAAKAIRGMGVRRASFIQPDMKLTGAPEDSPLEDPPEVYGTALAEGILLGLYKYDRYQSKKEPLLLSRVTFIADTPSGEKGIRRGVDLAMTVCEATCLARDLENAPGNEIYPETLARAARSAGRRSGFRVNVLGERRLGALGMGGLLAVAGGSARPPRLLVMEYRGGGRGRQGAGGSRRPVVLIGKGVTFDSGGISIKPSSGMAEMKMDMSGGAVVIAAMQAAAALKLPGRLIGIVPAAENLPGPSALRPGDILRHQNGMTSEVDNTDAEGRLILADALSYAARFDPALVIDLATLTGAVVVALGHFATGMMGNDPEAMRNLKESGERTYERVWELPMFEEYEGLIKSDVADVKNTGGRWGGAITAAMFLKKFTGSYNWVHLDIAGTSILEEPSDYAGRGGSGVGVRLLIDFLRHRGAARTDRRRKELTS
ncbi:MAG TPA: leucyl aminopeptidase [Bacteroidota bacterium]|nr:leucyl aminopeptidase [Bacteroidota bacterium]